MKNSRPSSDGIPYSWFVFLHRTKKCNIGVVTIPYSVGVPCIANTPLVAAVHKTGLVYLFHKKTKIRYIVSDD